jgi:cytochrome c5
MMKSMRGKAAMWMFATACSAAVAFGAGQNVSISDARGEQILNQSCTGCHELRNIETQALDKDGWTKEVNVMITKGSMVKAEDVPGLVDYLVRKHGPLPDGAGKQIMLNTCTMCHDLERIRQLEASRDEWEQTLLSMQNEGASISDDEFPAILNYLARNFGAKKQ